MKWRTSRQSSRNQLETERKTFKNLKAALTLEEFRTIADQYQSEAEKEGDTVSCHNVGTTQFGVNVEYEEVDFSKTRLRQRQRRKASIEFKVQNGETTISYPANEKVRHIVEASSSEPRRRKKSRSQSTKLIFRGLQTSICERSSFKS